ncbi:MAG: hypothetical protein FGF53_00040 [Candidatus Brockarchaeota archaeon]|nr:hypothetical protein [Candidatus Brockarchaeota archaeon]MBO3808233.1 hypothetical protein [Candidatus Brockarchaeota archaeon]
MMNKDLFEDTLKMLVKHAYKVRYVPHEVIEDYNATYNVIFKDKHIVTNAARELKIPLNEIWISEMWKSYEKYIIVQTVWAPRRRMKKPYRRVFPCVDMIPYSKR